MLVSVTRGGPGKTGVEDQRETERSEILTCALSTRHQQVRFFFPSLYPPVRPLRRIIPRRLWRVRPALSPSLFLSPVPFLPTAGLLTTPLESSANLHLTRVNSPFVLLRRFLLICAATSAPIDRRSIVLRFLAVARSALLSTSNYLSLPTYFSILFFFGEAASTTNVTEKRGRRARRRDAAVLLSKHCALRWITSEEKKNSY